MRAMFHAPDLFHHLSDLRFAHPLYVFQQIGSTNDQGKALAEAGAPEGLLIVAEEQTAGRGRSGRTWLTPPGTALAFSLVLRPALAARDAARLMMLAGLAVCDAIEETAGLRAALKWPNDVLIANKKTAGILVESATRGEQLAYAVLGIGVNVRWAPAPDQVDFPATCLEAEAGRPLDRTALLRSMLARLQARYPTLNEAALFDDWRARLMMLGEPAELRLDNETWTGRCEEVLPDGALLFRLDSGETRRVLAGNLHLRPRA